ncbi:MAG: penicillin-binding protein [Nitrospirae bacterium]|nr:penicillin-binding protein [Nitrospirota bacterium]MBI5097132.1 penicillin-binding protein [Nitrospirota bacterium]
MEQRWREYQKRFTWHRKIPRKTPFILVLAAVIISLAAGSPFLDTFDLSQKIRYTIEENGLRLSFDEESARIESETPILFKEKMEDKFVSNFENGLSVTYTIDPLLQEKMTDFFAKYKVPYGAFVAISPKTGKVLAMVEHSEKGSGDQHLALRATYPAASLFKLITAAAAIENGKVEPETVIRFNGGLYTLTPRNWVDNPKRDKNKITLADAMGKSCNVAFAKVALKWLGAGDILHYAENFGFNKALDFDLPVQMSQASIEDTEESIAKTAAGFGNVTLSPLHGALIASVIGNDGKMIAPRIIEKISLNGRELYNFKIKELDTCISTETAGKLKYMMTKTIESGTSRHTFYTRKGRAYLKDITIGGKTGTLEGDNPPGDYSWFIGMAPLEDPEIAVAALVINQPAWQIKASVAAREALLTYFKSNRPKTASVQ